MDNKDNNFWEGAEIISEYNSEQAVNDGILIELRDMLKKINKGKEHYLSHITTNLAGEGYINLNDGKVNLPNLLDLINQISNHINKRYNLDGVYDQFYSLKIEFPSGQKEEIFVVMNEFEKYTVMKTEDY